MAEAIQNMESDTVTLEELVPFAWEAVYTFEPYTSKGPNGTLFLTPVEKE